jgi:multimeric flavodoxin WrbA
MAPAQEMQMPLSETQESLCSENATDYSDLRAVIVNTSLKKASAVSHTRLLLGVVGDIMSKSGVAVEHVHLLDHQIPPGVYPDMTEHGWQRDDWPKLWPRIEAAQILVIGTPLWLGEESSVCRVLIERLYGMSGMLNERGQSIYYNKVGGCVVTGNEDRRAGFDNDFTQRNTTIMTWNLMHLAKILRDAGGIPNHGNDRQKWKAGCRFDFQNPDYRA